MKIVYFSTLFLVLLLGCKKPQIFEQNTIAALASPSTEFNNNATVYVFRNDSSASMLWPIKIKSDDIDHGSIRRSQYIKFGIEQGKHVMIASWPPPPLCSMPDIGLRADFENNKTYYFIVGPDISRNWRSTTFATSLKQITKDEASELIKSCTKGNSIE